MKFLETINCPVCNSNMFTIINSAQYSETMTQDEIISIYSSASDIHMMDQLVRCKSCSTVYLNPRVKSDIIMNSYTNTVDTVFTSQNLQRIITFKNSLNYIIKRFGIIPSKKTSILDIGCAGGAFPKAADDLGFSVIGIEPSKWLSEKGRDEFNLDIRPGTLEDNRFDDNTFDVITLWDVIEHLTDPGRVLSEVHRILKSDGLLIINYPAYDSLPRKILQYKWPFFLNVHLIYFTRKTITEFLNNRTFDVLEIKPYFQILQLGYILKRASSYYKFFNVINKICTMLHINTIPVKYYMGQSMLVAKKNDY